MDVFVLWTLFLQSANIRGNRAPGVGTCISGVGSPSKKFAPRHCDRFSDSLPDGVRGMADHLQLGRVFILRCLRLGGTLPQKRNRLLWVFSSKGYSLQVLVKTSW